MEMPNLSSMKDDDRWMKYIDSSAYDDVKRQSVPSIYVTDMDLAENLEHQSLLRILTAGGASPLSPLSRSEESLKDVDPAVAIQRLVWTPITKWNDLKNLSKYNVGLRIAFSKSNAAFICNFIIKTRYPEEAKYLGLDIAAPVSSKWLTPSGPQVTTIKICERKFWLEIIAKLNLITNRITEGHHYRPSISFMDPGPGLLYGLESGMVLINKDPKTGRVCKAVRCDVVQKCLHALTEPWYISPRYELEVMPRSELGAVTWYYDQYGGREDAVEALEDILAQAEPRESLNFDDESH
ncbi:hypothetical protein VTL71DRAFT_10155 [Oculimacula yallundae]|uniref:Uncharacterized protein n=1 Tax=Oculimacula yallundae TaxID=86028 RepID=A0ABR4BPR6_9HELO